MKKYLPFLASLLILCGLLAACLFLPESFAGKKLKEALFYQQLDAKSVQCLLCPRKCFITDGGRGFCGVRENRGGKLYSLVYAEPVALHVDPIEKKPFFHFLPSTTAFSIATVGCNLRCKFCQNWQISQAKPGEVPSVTMSADEVVLSAVQAGSRSIAYTYSEPTVFYEYMLDITKAAKAAGLKNILHSSGFINEAPLRQLCEYLDAANIDLKGWTSKYYDELCLGSVDDVLRTLKILNEKGVHLEVTNLILPGLNDDEKTIREMCAWIKDNLGEDTPLHFSRFHPMYKMAHLIPTPADTLEKAGRIAKEAGLKYVYIGNLPGNSAENTFCPRCGKIVIKRQGFFVMENNLLYGKCRFCGEEIKGVWK